MTLRRILPIAVLAISVPFVSHAQSLPSCPAGQSYQPTPGVPGSFSCQPNAISVPEIGASSSIGGLAVLMGGLVMLRGRKRNVAVSSASAV